MEGLILLAEARAAGLKVEADGGDLVIRGPRSAEPIVRRLLEHKPAESDEKAFQHKPRRGLAFRQERSDLAIAIAAGRRFWSERPRHRRNAAARPSAQCHTDCLDRARRPLSSVIDLAKRNGDERQEPDHDLRPKE